MDIGDAIMFLSVGETSPEKRWFKSRTECNSVDPCNIIARSL